MGQTDKASWRYKIRRAVENPGLALAVARARGRGMYYRLKFRLLRRRVVIGRRFQVTGPLDIRGPGTVIFGDDCAVNSTRLQPTTPYTHSPEAVIQIGNRVKLGSTRFGCERRIEVHDDAGISDARLMDTDFHSVEVSDTHRSNTSGVAKRIVIGRNVWIAAAAMVLKGVRIGENSVVGAGSVVMYNVPPNTVVIGNPARVVWRLQPPTDAEPSTSSSPPSTTAEEPERVPTS